jgi:hypothetical protein
MNVTQKQNVTNRKPANNPLEPQNLGARDHTPDTPVTLSTKQRIGDDKEPEGKNVNLKKTKNAKRTHFVFTCNSKAATPLRQNGFVPKSHLKPFF